MGRSQSRRFAQAQHAKHARMQPAGQATGRACPHLHTADAHAAHRAGHAGRSHDRRRAARADPVAAHANAAHARRQESESGVAN
eukprot:356113-Chlamydomonas_euryale.AAC.6